MSSEIVPMAYGDALIIASDAPPSILPMSVGEMHLFSYLGCVLALFKGKAIGEWGYQYAVTSEGFPFSEELDAARESLFARGLIEMTDEQLMQPTQPQISDELELIQSLAHWISERRPWLRSATECALAFPVGAIRHAINQTPGVAVPLRLGQRRKLLDPDDVGLLYNEYEVVSKVLGPDVRDTLSPAVLWLSARVLRSGGGADLGL
ncbi:MULTISPECIES: hypothetical protein [Bradyrhizobium]|jgi:hypothetical protein|uniref:hypothetical protein n=2 Tax=Nitrobacteraceae TaxID=41294 RepID=UPI0020234CDF|nr:hypothetical protein [Bradyrhizobium denitrificans]MCL8486589.1 hypothetical protein [Bradyrhizobium denitrificans]